MTNETSAPGADSAGIPVPAGEPARGRAHRIVVVALGIAVVSVVVQSAAHLINVQLLDDRVFNLNADAEGNALTWLSSVATFAAALAAFVLALLAERPSRPLLALAAILAFFSLDDAVVVHERIARRVVETAGLEASFERFVWPMLYFPLLLAALVLLGQLAMRAGSAPRRAIAAGVVLLGLAVAAELVSAAAYTGGVERGSLVDAVEIAIEEGAELGGWILISAGVVAAVQLALAASPRSR